MKKKNFSSKRYVIQILRNVLIIPKLLVDTVH